MGGGNGVEKMCVEAYSFLRYVYLVQFEGTSKLQSRAGSCSTARELSMIACVPIARPKV